MLKLVGAGKARMITGAISMDSQASTLKPVRFSCVGAATTHEGKRMQVKASVE